MYVIRRKKDGKVIHIDHSPYVSVRSGKEIYEGFDERTMEVGWTDKRRIPIHFNIDQNGKIIELSLEELIEAGHLQLSPFQKFEKGKIVNKSRSELIQEGFLKLEKVKEQSIMEYSAMALNKRRGLVDDYKLLNAALDIYNDGLKEDYRATVKAFRDEFYRIKAQIEKAVTVEDIDAIKPQFPESIVSAAKKSKG